jgi:CBS domain-containing protein
VGRAGKIEGIITDRDIVVRAVSKGKNPAEEKVSGYMTSDLHSCKESSTIHEAAEVMKKKKISRLVVVNDKNEFSGILSFGHIFRDDANAEEAADIVTRVSARNGKVRTGKTKKSAAA